MRKLQLEESQASEVEMMMPFPFKIAISLHETQLIQMKEEMNHDITFWIDHIIPTAQCKIISNSI